MYSDDDIIAGCQKKDRKAQEMLFTKYAGYMMGICLRYSKNKDDAQDLLHDGFIKVFDTITGFKGQSSIKTWLSSIFVNLSVSDLRKKAQKKYDDLDEAEISESESGLGSEEIEDSFNQLSINEVLELLQLLPDKYRLIINMYAIDNYSHKDIAIKLNISEGTSKSQLSRARKMLHTLISENKNQYEKVS